MRVITVVCEKWSHFRGFLPCIVVGKFSEGQPVRPVVLVVTAGNAEVSFQSLVHTFCLTVRLWMEGRRFSRVNLEDRGDGGPEMRRENGTSVRDDRVWEAVQSDDVGYEEAGEFRGVCSLGTSDEMGHLGHSIDEHEDRVLAV